jgi:ABC-type amino acid transport substrate-binding protein
MSRPPPFAVALRAILIAGLALAAPVAVQAAELKLGLRADAPPFSHRKRGIAAGTPDDPNALVEVNASDYSGYMVDICKRVAASMPRSGDGAMTVKWYEVTSENRFDKLNAGAIDVLCDPTTLTAERLRKENVMASQPVYLSGVGIASNPALDEVWNFYWPCRGALIGVVKGSTAADGGIERIREARGFSATAMSVLNAYPLAKAGRPTELTPHHLGRLGQCGDEAPDAAPQTPTADTQKADAASAAEEGKKVAAQTSTQADAPIETPKAETQPENAVVDANASKVGAKGAVGAPAKRKAKPLIREFATHEDLAAAFCAGQVYSYVGDVEIVSRMLLLQNRCAFAISPKTFSEERYAIFAHVSSQYSPQDALAVSFLRQLSIEVHRGRKSVLVDAFEENFGGADVSPTLDVFMWSVVAKSTP